MNSNYLLLLELVSLLMILFCTGYFVLPHLPKPRCYTSVLVVFVLTRQKYEKDKQLEVYDFTVFEKYEIWRYTERRKAALLV